MANEDVAPDIEAQEKKAEAEEKKGQLLHATTDAVIAYFEKFQGQHEATPTMMAWDEFLVAFCGSFISMAVLALVQFNAFFPHLGSDRYTMIIGSFGASCGLVYSAIASPLAQPRNAIGGHTVSAFLGVVIAQIFAHTGTNLLWLQCALSVSIAVTAMNALKCLHPPAAGTALIAVLPSLTVQPINWLYIGLPVCTGAVILVIIGIVVDNLSPRRQYPKFYI